MSQAAQDGFALDLGKRLDRAKVQAYEKLANATFTSMAAKAVKDSVAKAPEERLVIDAKFIEEEESSSDEDVGPKKEQTMTMSTGRPAARAIQLQKVLAMGPSAKPSRAAFAGSGSPLYAHSRALSSGTGASSRHRPIQRVSSPLFMGSEVSALDMSRHDRRPKAVAEEYEARSDLTPDFNKSRQDDSMPPSATQLQSAPVETEVSHKALEFSQIVQLKRDLAAKKETEERKK